MRSRGCTPDRRPQGVRVRTTVVFEYPAQPVGGASGRQSLPFRPSGSHPAGAFGVAWDDLRSFPRSGNGGRASIGSRDGCLTRVKATTVDSFIRIIEYGKYMWSAGIEPRGVPRSTWFAPGSIAIRFPAGVPAPRVSRFRPESPSRGSPACGTGRRRSDASNPRRTREAAGVRPLDRSSGVYGW